MRMNKWLAISFLALSAATLFAPTAATRQDGQQGQSTAAEGQPALTDQEMQDMRLSDDQKSQIKSINKSRHEQVQAIRNDSSLTNQQKAQRIREVEHGSNQQIRGLLDPEQQRRFDRRVRDRHEDVRDRREDRRDRREDVRDRQHDGGKRDRVEDRRDRREDVRDRREDRRDRRTPPRKRP